VPRRALTLIPLLLAALALAAHAQRIKDIVEIQGIRKNQLYGYGIVIGLDGTGDSAAVTKRVLANVLRRMDLSVSPSDVSSANVASVIVTADLPAFAKEGMPLDVTVNVIGDASSLQGGTLLATPLFAADGQVYALAQGPLSIGGFQASGKSASIQKNHPTVGRIPQGATVEREEPTDFVFNRTIGLNLRNPDFTTSSRLADAVNAAFPRAAVAVDAGTILVIIPDAVSQAGLAAFISDIGLLDVQPDTRAVVIVNERTGTVVAGENVRISTVAISHGNLSVITRESELVSQPQPFTRTGRTVQVPDTDIEVSEEPGALHVIDPGVTVSDLARALNAMGVTPRDLIAIFEALSRAGALQASLEIM